MKEVKNCIQMARDKKLLFKGLLKQDYSIADPTLSWPNNTELIIYSESMIKGY